MSIWDYSEIEECANKSNKTCATNFPNCQIRSNWSWVQTSYEQMQTGLIEWVWMDPNSKGPKNVYAYSVNCNISHIMMKVIQTIYLNLNISHIMMKIIQTINLNYNISHIIMKVTQSLLILISIFIHI